MRGTESAGRFKVKNFGDDWPLTLKLEHFSLAAGGRFLLETCDFSAGLEGISVLAGPNGAGKTSFLKCLVGLESGLSYSGMLEILGHSPKKARTCIGYMPQKDFFGAGGGLSVRQHLKAALEGEKWGMAFFHKREERNRLEALLALCGVAELAHTPVRALSGGEARKVALAICLCRDPALLICDEPFAGLDVPAQKEIERLFTGLCAERRMGILYSSHPGRPETQLAGVSRLWMIERGCLHAAV